MKIADRTWMLEIGRENRSLNPVFCWDDHFRVLFDAGLPGQVPLFEAALAELGFSLGDVTHLLLTHQDMDHIGIAKDLLALAPAAQVWAHAAEAPYICGEQTPVKLAQREADGNTMTSAQREELAAQKAAYATRTVPISRLLKDQEVLPLCGGIKVIHTPGHTPGHACYLLHACRTLVVGDALNATDGRLTGANPRYTADMDLSWKSIEKLSYCDASVVASYHGGLVCGDIPLQLSNLAKNKG